MNKNHYRLIIIGSGPAGLTAGIYSARARLEPLIFTGTMPGGQLMGTTTVENWPGEASIMGPQLMMNMRSHAERTGAQFYDASIEQLDVATRPFRLYAHNKEQFTAEALIITTGATPRTLNCPGEKEYWGKGVSTCAVCDGALYHGKKIIVVGGGDTAMEDASFMARIGNNVTVLHIRDKLSASPPMQERVLNNPNIAIRYQTTVSAILGSGTAVTGVTTEHQATKQKEQLEADAVFIAIGQVPNSSLVGKSINRSERGTILTYHGTTQTSVPGVFAAGDVVDAQYRQAITSAGDGCRAALDAERFLAEHATQKSE